MHRNENIDEVLAKIAELANSAIHADADQSGEGKLESTSNASESGCVIKQLPKRLLIKAAENATTVNVMNAPVFGASAELAAGFSISDPL